jgi:hypothetical protein
VDERTHRSPQGVALPKLVMTIGAPEGSKVGDGMADRNRPDDWLWLGVWPVIPRSRGDVGVPGQLADRGGVSCSSTTWGPCTARRLVRPSRLMGADMSDVTKSDNPALGGPSYHVEDRM